MTAKVLYNVIKSADSRLVDDIINLYISGGWWGDDSKPEIIPDMVKGSFLFLAAVDDNGKMVGMGRAISDGVSDAYIQDVVVLKEMRGTGIGREIIKTLTRECVQAGIMWIGLVAEPGTEAFYAPLGFRRLKGFTPLKYSME